MISYRDLIKYFKTSLFDKDFQAFLTEVFSDLTEYDITNSDYIISEATGLELGFTNNDAIYDEDTNIVFKIGDPLFSHYNIYQKSTSLIHDLPFNINFSSTRNEVINKAGQPIKTNEGYSDILEKNFLVDSYKLCDIIITFDYNPENNIINFIQVRSNRISEHLTL